ncbi:Fe-S cluster assembly protein SufD [Clostridium sp. D2Q-14]|uniref:Fe-S cluster assembly protein SufD n=1 Tax=Anaeromonas gelatinilytica TaxID=2683194 RepID=UPI00193C2015|nr:Fe-S cluster assembly protein SufD [Anaeromonas gelatinilytica]MBS4534855.1 Fe-S cluster assembly protein SufD [Anaeromonas gelatinilytica]
MYNENLLNNLSFKEYRLDKLKKYNKLQIPKWKRINLQDFDIPDYREYNNLQLPGHEDLDIRDMGTVKEDINEFTRYLRVNEEFGVDKKFVTLTEALSNSGVIIKIEKNKRISEPIRLDFKMDNDNPLLLDHNLIIAKRNSELTVVMDYTSNTKVFHSGVTKVYAEDNSNVTIIKLQRMDEDSDDFDSNIAIVGRDAKVNWVSIELGGKITASSFITNLKEDNSKADLKSIYFGDKDMEIDVQYKMNHFGRRSESNINTKGALKDRAKKVFRGDLDFKKGASRSKGEEEEYVLLLDKTVKSDAIPALICGEDDVEGEHAASAGQINELKLFYLMSRGISESQAKKMIVEASFKPVIDKIPYEDLKEKVEENIHRRLIDEKS